MNRWCIILIAFLLLLINYQWVFAQQEVMVVTPASEAAENLDLRAVSELFKDSDNLEKFEKGLNNPEIGLNNLDLDENGEVDFLRVVEDVVDNVHLIIIQVSLGENEFQDVATIEIEKIDDEKYSMQIHGNEILYGADYYVVPSYVNIHRWRVIAWLYRPVYRPYRSVFYFGNYPPWWKPYRPVTIKVYRTRTVKLTGRKTFTHTKTTRIKGVKKIKYKPRTSKLVKRKMLKPKTKKAMKKPPKRPINRR